MRCKNVEEKSGDKTVVDFLLGASSLYTYALLRFTSQDTQLYSVFRELVEYLATFVFFLLSAVKTHFSLVASGPCSTEATSKSFFSSVKFKKKKISLSPRGTKVWVVSTY